MTFVTKIIHGTRYWDLAHLEFQNDEGKTLMKWVANNYSGLLTDGVQYSEIDAPNGVDQIRVANDGPTVICYIEYLKSGTVLGKAQFFGNPPSNIIDMKAPEGEVITSIELTHPYSYKAMPTGTIFTVDPDAPPEINYLTKIDFMVTSIYFSNMIQYDNQGRVIDKLPRPAGGNVVTAESAHGFTKIIAYHLTAGARTLFKVELFLHDKRVFVYDTGYSNGWPNHIIRDIYEVAPNERIGKLNIRGTQPGFELYGMESVIPVMNLESGWTEWSNWGECDVACGDGISKRTRKCYPNIGPCDDGIDTETRHCGKPCPIDGGWSDWKLLSACDASCGLKGVEVYSRDCNNPSPNYGGKDCIGSITKTVECDGPPCPIDGGWSDWKLTSECDARCDEQGVKKYTRQCTNPAPQYGGSTCPGSETKNVPCYGPSCPIDGGWSDWSPWSECDVDYGDGTKTRTRECTNPVPQNGGAGCVGDAIEIADCNNGPAPIDGGWSEWTQSECSAVCGEGTAKQTRTCTNPAPQNGGADCVGESEKTVKCKTDCTLYILILIFIIIIAMYYNQPKKMNEDNIKS